MSKCLSGCVCGRHAPRTFSEEHRKRISESKLGVKNPKSSAAKIGKPSYERTSAHRQIMSESCLLRESNPEYKARKIAGQTGTTRTITDKLKASHATHSQWMKDQYAAGTGWAQKVLFAVSPNKLEQYMIEHLQPLGWEFVGDGQVWIVGKNPDFIHRRAHRLLEIFGDYWHRNDDSQERIDHFAKYGWACTVIWESAIKKDIAQVLKQL